MLMHDVDVLGETGGDLQNTMDIVAINGDKVLTCMPYNSICGLSSLHTVSGKMHGLRNIIGTH